MLDSPEPPKTFIEKLQERAAASRFFTVSLLLHVVLIVMGGSVVLFQRMAPQEDFAAADGLVGNEVQVQAPPETQPEMQQQFTPQAPTLSAPSLAAITTTAATPTFTVASVAPVIKPVQTDAMANKINQASLKGIASGLPSAMSGRAGGTARAQMMEANKGKKEGEIAVMKGLNWLKTHQNPDGSWADADKSAMTGFALLSFLGHGETPVSVDFGATVQKAVDWLVAEGNKNDGKFANFDQHGVYAHAIAAYGIGEYYTMTKDERVAELLKKATGHIVQGQAADGGWQYGYAKGPKSDTSVSGWQIQSLKAAHLSGLNIEGVDPALDKAMLNLKRVQADDGSFGYTEARNDYYSLTGAGVLCTFFWKQEKDASVRKGINYLMEATDKDHPVDYHHEKADLYAWYYNTQACLMVGGAAWNKWNRLFQDQIIKNQNPDGSWPPVAGKSPGGEIQRDPEGAGPYYRTNLCILMLEVYYRYSPTMK